MPYNDPTAIISAIQDLTNPCRFSAQHLLRDGLEPETEEHLWPKLEGSTWTLSGEPADLLQPGVFARLQEATVNPDYTVSVGEGLRLQVVSTAGRLTFAQPTD